jgi:hypothetical protein
MPMCEATSRAIWSCDWGSDGDTPIAAAHRGDDVPDSPSPKARWTT